MEILGKRIKLLRKSRGFTQKKLANMLGIADSSTVSQWERGVNSPYGRDLVKLCDIFNVSSDYVLGIEDNEIPLFEYKYFPTAISAGIPIDIEGITQSEKITIHDHVMGKHAMSKDVFFTKASGDSMDKVIPDESLIAIKPISLDGLKNGDIVVYSSEHEYSVKHYYKHGDTIVFKPNSTNQAHHDQIYSVNDNIKIHGKVVLYIVNLD